MTYRIILLIFITYVFLYGENRRVLKTAVLNDFPPLYITDVNGNPKGLAIDILQEFASAQGLKIVYIKTANWEEATNALRDGRADCIPGIGYERKKMQEFYYSQEMETEPVCLFVLSSNTSIKNISDTKEKSVGVIKGSVAEGELEQNYKTTNSKRFETIESALFSLLSGHIDAFLFPEPVMRKKLQEIGLTKRVKITGDPVVELKRGYLFRKNDSLFVKDTVNQFLEKFTGKKDYLDIYFKWYGKPSRLITLQAVLITASAVAVVVLLIFVTVWIFTIRKVNKRLRSSLEILEKTKKDLSDSETRYRVLAETSPFGIAVAELQSGNLLFVNSTFCSMFGYRRDEVKTLKAVNLHPAESRDQVQDIFTNANAENSAQVVVNIHDCIRNDGCIFQCRVHASQLIVADTKCLVGFFVDITEELKLQEKQRQAEKLMSIGQLAGGIAHDFNNQLAGIIGYCDIILDSLDKDSSFYKYVEKIITIVNRSSDLNRQLLAFARKGKYTDQIVNVHVLVDEVINLLQHSLDKKITIRANPCATMVNVKGDASQIQNAILNLAINARDAINGSGEIHIVTQNVELYPDTADKAAFEIKPGTYISIAVTDTGIGMSQDVKSHLFEPFFTTKEKGKGTGMGLAAVYGTVRNHQGTIRVYSEEGRGSTLTIFLPVDGSTAEILQQHNYHVSKKLDNSVYTVLFVDDEENIRDVALSILTSEGYNVKVCNDGAKAVAYYRDNWKNVDLVIVDMVMPAMDGNETFSNLKQINSSVRVILSTGYTLNSLAQSILDKGAMGFIQKPFRKQTLLDAVVKVLSDSLKNN